MLDVPLLGVRLSTGLELSNRKCTCSLQSRPHTQTQEAVVMAHSHILHPDPTFLGRGAVKCNAGALHSQAAIIFESMIP